MQASIVSILIVDGGVVLLKILTRILDLDVPTCPLLSYSDWLAAYTTKYQCKI